MSAIQTVNGQPTIYQSSAPSLANGDSGAFLVDVNQNLLVSLATLIAGEDLTNNVLRVEAQTNYTQTSSSTAIKSSAGRLSGIFVSAASSTPTIKIWDNTVGSGSVLIDTFTPVAATYYPFPFANATNGIYITISGTVSCTVFYK